MSGEASLWDGPAPPGMLAFEGHPYGLVVSDPAGAVVAFNRSAARLIGSVADLDAGGAGGSRTICDAVGCRRAEGPLEHTCLHELAAERGEPLPEVRVDLPDGAESSAAWVTVAPLPGSPVLILTELRPGMADDRRRRTAPHWTSGPHLRIVTLGRMRLLGNEGQIEGRWLANRSGQILKFLVAQRHRTVYADEIAETLWRENTSSSVKALRYFVHVLRTDLEPDRKGRGKSSFILAEPGGYALNTATIRIDADEFERHVTAGHAALRAGDLVLAREHLSAGVELYGGDFLADEPYAEWALDERDRLHNLAAEALRTLVELKREADDLEEAVADLQRLTNLEPFDTEAHAELLGLLVRRGRRSEAVRRYQALRHRMLSTFGEDVEFSLSDLIVH
jgi:DNA-binding SARP family transcriptional activator